MGASHAETAVPRAESSFPGTFVGNKRVRVMSDGWRVAGLEEVRFPRLDDPYSAEGQADFADERSLVPDEF